VAGRAPSTPAEREEYAVWAAALTQMVADFSTHGDKVERVVLADRTDTRFVGDVRRRLDLDGAGSKGGKRRYRLTPMASLEGATIDDFQAKNATPLVLDDFFQLKPLRVSFISVATLHELLNRDRGWKEFYARYPGATGLVTVSRVGLNPARTQALVYIGVQTHGLGGWGVLSLFEKHEGVWRKEGEQQLWIS
jgi:hypothetical protein